MLRTVAICTLTLLVTLAGSLGAADKPAHHGERRFVNPYAEQNHGGLFGILRARFSDAWQGYDAERDRVPITRSNPIPAHAASRNATVTWIGHATVLIQHQGINVLTDPMFSDYASPLSFAGPKRITRPAIAIDDLPPIHAVVISHNHYDHLDTRSIKALGDSPRYFVPLGIGRWLVAKGIDPSRVTEMDWWAAAGISVAGQSLEITATPSQHFSGRGLTDRNATLWAAWRLTWDDFSAWFGGDTGYNDVQFKQIAQRLGPVDLGIIPIGAYEPRWFMQTVHVNPAEAVKIHRDVAARASMGIHWGAFVLAGEGVLTPPAALANARLDAGLTEDEFAVFAVGETRRYAPGSH